MKKPEAGLEGLHGIITFTWKAALLLSKGKFAFVKWPETLL